MKLRNILSRDKFLRPYLDLKTGGIYYGNYYVNNILKIGAITRKGKRVTIQLLPTYNLGNTISLKPNKNILGYKVIFYGELTKEQNYNLIKQSYRNMDKAQILNFWSVHAKELENVFGKEYFDHLLLKTCFELNRLPFQFEILHKGKIVTNIASVKEEWNTNEQSFELLSYKK